MLDLQLKRHGRDDGVRSGYHRPSSPPAPLIMGADRAELETAVISTMLNKLNSVIPGFGYVSSIVQHPDE